MAWDWLFGTPETDKALADEDYSHPIYKRLALSRGLGSAAQAVVDAGRQGGGFGPYMAAIAGGLGKGLDEAGLMRGKMAQGRQEVLKAKYDPLGLLPAQAKLLGQQGASGNLTPVGPGAGQTAPARPGTTPTGPQAPGSGTPPITALKEGVVTTFANGQKWTLRNGIPQRVS